jgi:anti-sigma B factor antagonist
VTKAKSGKAVPTVLRVEGEMTIYRAAELKSTLLAPIGRTGTASSLDIDLSGVADIDCAGIQLLMLAKKTAQQRNCELRLMGHSPAVAEAFELLNLAGYFGDPIVIAPST